MTNQERTEIIKECAQHLDTLADELVAENADIATSSYPLMEAYRVAAKELKRLAEEPQ